MVEPTVPAGWYPDPSDAAQLRWFDGTQWTPSTAPTVGADPRSTAALLAGTRPRRSKGTTLMARGFLLSGGAVGAIFAELIIAGGLMSAVGTPVPGHPGSYTMPGPAGAVGAAVLVLTILAIPVGIIIGIVGAVTSASTRRSRVEEAHQELRAARENASSAYQVAAVQAAAIPGRTWRTLLASYWWLLPIVGAVACNTVGLSSLALMCLVLAMVFKLAAVARSRFRAKKVASRLAESTGVGPGGAGDLGALAVRTEVVRAAAAAAGWQFDDSAGPGIELVAGGMSAQNVCTGTVDGGPFALFDAVRRVTIGLVEGQDPHPRTTVADAQTTVQMPFAAVFRLAAVQGSVADDLAWSAFGPPVQLESAEFAARFHVYCDDPFRTRLVLNPAVMSLLLQAPYPVELILQRGVLQVVTPGTLVPGPSLSALVATTSRLHSSARSAIADVPA